MEKIIYEQLIHLVLVEVNGDAPRIANELNKIINYVLLKEKSIKQLVSRVQALTDTIISIDYHATFDANAAIKLLSAYFNGKELVRGEVQSRVDPASLRRIARQDLLSNSQSGGGAGDERGIDERVKLLVETINSIPNFKTFSSCEGHGKAPFYVLWIVTDNTLNNLNTIVKMVSEIGNDIIRNYPDLIGVARISFAFGHDCWGDDTREGYLGEYSNIPFFSFNANYWGKTPFPDEFYEFLEKLCVEFAKQAKETKWIS